MNPRANKLYRTYIAIIEFAILTAVYFLCIYLRTGSIALFQSSVFLLGYFLLVVLRVVLIKILDPYKDMSHRGHYREFRNVLKISTFEVALLIVSLYMLGKGKEFSRTVFIVFYLLEIVFDWIVRYWYKEYFNTKHKGNGTSQKLLVITTSDKIGAILKSMNENDDWFYDVFGCAILDKEMTGQTIAGVPVVAGHSTVRQYVIQNVVDAVFLDGNMKNDDFQKLINLVSDIGSMLYINLANFGMELTNERIIRIGGFTTLSSSRREISPIQNIAKRAMDIAGGLVGSIFTVLLTIILGLIIKIDSPGPIFFRQERVGRNGRRFKMFKYRSMYIDAEERKSELMKQNKMRGLMFKMDNDPRITRVGKFIRKTSLDEFPQFFNVLLGDMSLVGTRPPTVGEFQQYESHHKKRLSMKPGLTGLWQVSGRSDITDFEEVVELDSKYIDSWDIGMDVKILVKTVGVLFGDRHAS